MKDDRNAIPDWPQLASRSLLTNPALIDQGRLAALGCRSVCPRCAAGRWAPSRFCQREPGTTAPPWKKGGGFGSRLLRA